MATDVTKTHRTRAQLARRIAVWTGLVACGLVVVAVVFLCVPGVRARILRDVITRVDAKLPGDFTVDHAAWPSPGTIEASGIEWTDSTKTLARAAHLRVSVRLLPLLRRDIAVERAEVAGAYVNAPAIAAALARTLITTKGSTAVKRPFPRGGSVAGAPSIALANALVSIDSIRVGDRGVLTGIELAASANLLRGQRPGLRVDRFGIESASGAWGIDSMSVDVDLSRGVVDGSAHARVSSHWPFVATLSSEQPDQLVVTATARAAVALPDTVGARVVVEVVRDGLIVSGVRVSAEVRTPGTAELAGDPALTALFAGVPDLEGIAASFTASIDLVPEVSLGASLDVHENSWINGGHVEATYRGGATEASATLTLDGLGLAASGRGSADSLYAHVTADVTSAVWLRTLHPGTAVPDSIRAHLDVLARSARPLRSVRAAVLAHASDLYTGATVEVVPGEEIVARISPVALGKTPLGEPPALGGGSDATLRWNSARGDVSLKDLRVTSDFGHVRADASMAASKDITYVVDAIWPTPPPALLNYLANLDRAQRRALEADWTRDGPFALRARGTIDAARATRAHVAFDLPGPRTLASLLPNSARVSDLGTLAGTIDATVRVGTGRLDIDADADLSATSWIDTGRAHVAVRGDRVRIDSVTVALESIRVSAQGLVSSDSLAVTAHAVVDGAGFLRRFSPRLPDVRATIDTRARGTVRAPAVDAALMGTVNGIDFTGNVHLGDGGSTIRLNAPGGVRTSRVYLDRLEASLSSTGSLRQLFPARVAVNASGPGVDVRQSAMVSIDTGPDARVTARVDTLGVTLDGRSLGIEAPFTIGVGNDQEVSVDSLRLSGTLGVVRLSGVAGPSRTRFDGSISVETPSRPASLALPDNLWPSAVDATFHADTLGSLHADVAVKGIVLADGREPMVSAKIDAAMGRFDARVDVSEGGVSLANGRAILPATLVLVPPSLQIGAGEADITFSANGFPVVLRTTGWSHPARVDGTLTLSGPTASPAGRISATANFPGVPKLEAYRIRVAAQIDSSQTSRGASGTLGIERGTERVLDVEIDYPLQVSLTPPFATPVAGGTLRIHAESTTLALGELDPLLPSDVGLDGTIAIAFDATGPVDDPSLDGRITPRNLEVSVADRMRLLASGDVRIGGTAKKPSARGEIVIENGLIRISEPPKELLPTAGPASLAVHHDTAATDTAASSVPGSPRTPAFQGDVDVTVRIPSGLWIRGQGLDAELGGDLRIQQTAERPTLTGTLKALRGTLVFLGRNFQLDRGSVTFYGDDENNPTLDVQLSATLDGVTVRVIISGSAAEPEFALESDPEMQEGDIMSYLVFGKPLDTLDQDQVSLVEQRATEIAAAMGAVRLQEGLSRQLGIDMVTIRSGVAADEASAIVVGKYLNPRLLIKYERLLEEQAAQFINIEYFLTRRLKIDTLYGRQDQQGIEIEWSNEY